MSAIDRAWLRMDEPTNLMTINGVLLFDQPLDSERFKEVLQRRLLSVQRFRQRVVADGRHYVARSDGDFHHSAHGVMNHAG